VSGERFVARVRRLDTRLAAGRWEWAERNREAIAAHWAERVAEKPRMFNGRILIIVDHALEGDAYRATYIETDFANLLAWRDFGFPDDSVINGFAMAALQGADGAFVMGVMGAHTANAGRVYFPAGTPDPSDVRSDGIVDLAGSVSRELAEETGLAAEAFASADDWIVVRHGPRIAFLRPMRAPEPAVAVAARIEAHLRRDPDPELSAARVVRTAADIDEAAMPDFLQDFLRWSFADGGAETRSAS
jgi:8-oxo-dGTP pyrophosphatase MutT (NUDIX family)